MELHIQGRLSIVQGWLICCCIIMKHAMGFDWLGLG